MKYVVDAAEASFTALIEGRFTSIRRWRTGLFVWLLAMVYVLSCRKLQVQRLFLELRMVFISWL